MRAITFLITSGIIYLIAAFTVPSEWVNVVQLTWLFITALPLWFPPLERWMFPRVQRTTATTTTDSIPTTTWVLEAKFRELTDDEIKQVFVESTGFDFDDNPGDSMDLLGFAHNVIRKAQEK